MARAQMSQEIVETLFPLYDADMKALIARVYAAHRNKADIEERLIDAIWAQNHPEFQRRNLNASQSEANSHAQAEGGELTPSGRAAIRAYLNEAQECDEGLLELTDAALAARFEEVCGPAQVAQQAMKRERGLQADSLAFFNRTDAIADYAHWSALPVWSAEEAVALSFGKEPRRVNRGTLGTYKCLHGSPFRDDFLARLDYLERALLSKRLKDPLQPKDFLEWATVHNIDCPPTLVSSPSRSISPSKHLDIREINTLNKIILGLAIKHYGYDPTLENAKQSEVFEALKIDLSKVEANTSIPTLEKALGRARVWAHVKPEPLLKRIRANKEIAASRAAKPS